MGIRVKIKGADFSFNAIDGSVSTTYSVIRNLLHVIASNNATSVVEGSTYSVTLTPADGYDMDSVTVMHNGQAVSPTSGYTYTIDNVIGNIVINATAVEHQETNYSVTYNLTNVASSTNVTTVVEGSSFIVTLTPQTGYSINRVSVTHNGMPLMPTGSGFTYRVNNVAGDIVITAVAVEQSVNTFTVTYNLTNCSSDNNAIVVNEGANYSFTLSPDSGYDIDSVAVSHNGNTVAPTSGYTYDITNVSGNIVITASATQQVVIENKSLTILGKYDVNVSVTQDDSTITTSGTYTSANGSEMEVLTNTNIVVSVVPTAQGETIQGLLLNGNNVTSPFQITEDSVLVPKVNGNLAYVKYSGGIWSSNKTVATDSVHYRTEIIPVVKDEPLIIKVPNHSNETIKIRTWYCSSYGTYNADNSGLLSIELDANGIGTIIPKMSGHFALHPSYASDYTATVLSESDINGIEINYANTSAWGVPSFKWEKVLDLGAVSAQSSNNTWNQSAALYNGYMLTFSGTMRRIKVINLDTLKVIATVTNSSYQSDVHANSACFLTKKYSDNDYYPMLLTNVHGSASDKLTVFRLAGTTATSFTVQRICDWSFTNCSILDNQTNGNILYLMARAGGSYPELMGLWRIPMSFNDSSIYVDTTFDLSTMTGATRILPSFYQRTGQDCTIITQSGKDDIFVNSYGPSTDFPNKHAGLVFYRAGTSTGNLIGWLPTNRILNGYEHDGIVYAGNGVLYCIFVNSSQAYLYRFTITIPEYST